MPYAWPRSLCSAAVIFSIALLHPSTASSGNPHTVAHETPAQDSTPVLVELFTSEGCSSCPPADVMLQKLDQFQPIPGAHVIVLSEHVTYWDHDGWKDPNSAEMFTDRQSAYENALGQKTPYTPQFIVDGTQIIRIDQTQTEMDAIFQKARVTPKVAVHVSDIRVEAGSPSLLHAHVETGENMDKHGADVYLAVALNHAESQVLRGENGGRHLVHVAVVKQLTRIGKLLKGKNFVQDVQLKLGERIDPANLRLIAFVQDAGPGKVLGAAEGSPAGR